MQWFTPSLPQPLLHLGNVGVVEQGIGGGRGPQGMHADPWTGLDETDLVGIAPYNELVAILF